MFWIVFSDRRSAIPTKSPAHEASFPGTVVALGLTIMLDWTFQTLLRLCSGGPDITCSMGIMLGMVGIEVNNEMQPRYRVWDSTYTCRVGNMVHTVLRAHELPLTSCQILPVK